MAKIPLTYFKFTKQYYFWYLTEKKFQGLHNRNAKTHVPTSRVLTSVREFVTIKDPGNSCLQGCD